MYSSTVKAKKESILSLQYAKLTKTLKFYKNLTKKLCYLEKKARIFKQFDNRNDPNSDF